LVGKNKKKNEKIEQGRGSWREFERRECHCREDKVAVACQLLGR
jgi:hypothetical protein